MKTTKEHIEKRLNKHGTVTVYSPENIALEIHREPYITRDGGATLYFDMDCKDLAAFCSMSGLQFKPNNNN